MDATLIYPHQLFSDSPAVAPGRPIFLLEEPLLLTKNPIHRQKLVFHKLSLDAYESRLRQAGHAVTRLPIDAHPTTSAMLAAVKAARVTTVHVVDTTDDYLEHALATSGLTRVWYESPLFVLPRAEAVERYQKSNRHLAAFYKTLRQYRNILIEPDGQPTGGQWSFDAENRKKIPRGTPLPTEPVCFENQTVEAATQWAASVPAAQYGHAGCWLPYTPAGAEEFLTEFLRARLPAFGPYEDAMHTDGVRLWHSALSPLLNVGLLTPSQVLDAALDHASTQAVPLNSLEGFVRQVLGWREFIRASYELDGRAMRSQNFWRHTRKLPDALWDGSTGIDPVDHVVTTALHYGYTHHIERLMVMGNFMLLCGIHPTEVYRWFMGMYVDAYDWVMVPNVYGMSQFADGGSFATKPYISGSNYIKKMSNFPAGAWEETWTALYWHFIASHETVFQNNHRLAMMPRMLAKMDPTQRTEHLKRATAFLAEW